MLAPRVTTTGSSVMSARSPNRMLLSHPSTPPATVRIAIRRHPRMILFLAVASVRPNSLLSLCLIYISTLPANAVLVKKPPIKCLQTCQFNHDRSEGQAQASSSAAPARIPIVCIMRAFQQHARNHSIRLPHCIRECSGIRIFGMRIKSIAFTTDVPIIRVYSSNSQCDRQRGIFALSKTFFRRNTDVFQGKMAQRSVKRPAVRVRWELEEYTLGTSMPMQSSPFIP